jgi:hypothetical protein
MMVSFHALDHMPTRKLPHHLRLKGVLYHVKALEILDIPLDAETLSTEEGREIIYIVINM